MIRPRGDRFGARDLFGESVRGLAGRPGRLALTALAVVLGIGSLTATVGFAQTGARQLEATFNAVDAVHGVVRPAEQDYGAAGAQAVLPWDGDQTAARLNGVEAAGLVTEIELTAPVIAAAPVHDPMAPPTRAPGVMAATPGLLDAVSGTLGQGVWLTGFHEQAALPVAVLGRDAATLLGVTRVDNQPSVFIDERSYTVVGILDRVERVSGLLNAVIVPQSTARAVFGLAAPGGLQVKVALGAGPMVGEVITTALSPNDPSGFEVSMPLPPSKVRQQVTADVNSLFVILGLVALAIGAVTIAVVTSLSVIERRGEIGLRRALGATRLNVALQFVAESAVVGLLGGLTGAAAGVFATVGLAAARQWTPVLDLRLVGAAALTGCLVGVLAGLTPAIRAANLEPATALQEGA
ncbi:MAG: ABC transporter permease [Bifidobacteriaceae bacterium]|nr:ABC transporter permease [Bifidobacteriaceae bacterium]